jgi:4-amino-4-deoxy-L-arabinose transferase-like glycosyltransferase
MDSPGSPEIERQLRRTDILLLLLLCTLLFGYSLIHPRLMNAHEAVHCLNVREMMESGDYLIATYGGRHWLERPVVPHWLTAAGVFLSGDAVPERAFRVGSMFVATLAILVFAWAITGIFGRGIGVASAAMLATMREFAAYAVAPEADIFLASAVTVAGAILMRVLFDPIRGESRTSFFGRRNWSVAALMVLLGLTNAMKGPLFGLLFIALPLGVFWLWDRSRSRILPLIWFPGILLFLGCAVAWPLYAYSRYPDIVDLWLMDYGYRLKKGYIGAPWWYYLANQPWNFFPWTLPVLTGLAATFRAVRQASPVHRFLWCWAIVPVVFFSVFQGKHHHYMLNCMAPAAVLAAIGGPRLWAFFQEHAVRKRGIQVAAGVLSVAGIVGLYFMQTKVPGPASVWMIVAAFWVFAVIAGCYAFTRRSWPHALAGCVLVTVLINNAFFEYRTICMDDYREDHTLLTQVDSVVPGDRPLFVLGEFDVLNASWQLLYLNGKARLLHNETFLRDDRITTPDVYVICRALDAWKLAPYGNAELLLESRKTRREKEGPNRYGIYRVTLRPDLVKLPANIRMTPIEATGRALGPWLGEPPAYIPPASGTN